MVHRVRENRCVVTESIDLGTPVGRLIANVLAFLAEGELEAIRGRTKAGGRRWFLLAGGRVDRHPTGSPR